MPGKDKYDWPPDDELAAIIAQYGLKEAALRLGVPFSTIQTRAYARGIRVAKKSPVHPVESELDALEQRVAGRLRGKKPPTVEQLADEFDVAPGKVRVALESLRHQGYRIPEQVTNQAIVLESVTPDKVNLHRLDPSLLEGNQVTVGVVSDTHLSSNEEALSELHAAYDFLADRGITEVWHPGDWTCGLGIYRTQAAEIKNHTFETQVDYLVENYPRRDGIVTRGIAGNHDIEGEFGKIGANPVVALANRRDDIEYLGDFSAWLELPGGAWIHMLHGKGGGSYAFSYQAQKLAESYPMGRKPAVLILGHFHRRGAIEARGIQVMWAGCFEWKSNLLKRLGLTPAVGFHVLHMTIGPDGSLVRFMPEWIPFYEGRVLAA